MKNYPNYLITSGSYREIPAADVKDRVERFVRRNKACYPKDLKEPWKGLVIYTLVEYFEWDFKDAADFLEVSVRTAKDKAEEAKRMFRAASFASKISYNGSKFVNDLRDYIYYNISRR